VPNDGALSGIPDDVAVEVPAIANLKGIQPLRVEPLPAKVMLEQIYPDWLEMERTLEAFHTGDKSILLASNPSTAPTRRLATLHTPGEPSLHTTDRSA
jgi:alpha-galactosidase